MSFESVVSQVKSLPPLGDSIVKVQALYKEEEIDVIKLTRAIESDPFLTTNLLSMINDPKYKFANKIVSVSQAITLLGTRILHGFLMNISMHRHFVLNMRPYGLSNAMFLAMCSYQSALMFQWYMPINMRNAQILVSLSLIMESGKVILAKELVESSYGLEFKEALEESKDITDVEELYTDTSSYFISGLLFEHWNFDPIFIQAMKAMDYEIEDESLIEPFIGPLNVIRTAINPKEILTDHSIKMAAREVEALGHDPISFKMKAERLAKHFQENY